MRKIQIKCFFFQQTYSNPDKQNCCCNKYKCNSESPIQLCSLQDPHAVLLTADGQVVLMSVITDRETGLPYKLESKTSNIILVSFCTKVVSNKNSIIIILEYFQILPNMLTCVWRCNCLYLFLLHLILYW